MKLQLSCNDLSQLSRFLFDPKDFITVVAPISDIHLLVRPYGQRPVIPPLCQRSPVSLYLRLFPSLNQRDTTTFLAETPFFKKF